MSASQTCNISNISSSLERLKAQRESQRELQSKPFPLWALLYFCEIGNRNDWYCDYFSGFKLLVSWLGPIDIPNAPSSLKIPRLHRTYELQEIATILNSSQESIYHGHKTTFSFIQFASNTSQLPT